MPPTNVSKRFRIIFFGSSEFSIMPFEALLNSTDEISAVVTTPDRPQGRGLRIQSNPVKELAEKKGVRIFAPETLKTGDAEGVIQKLSPDVFVVASYGKLIPERWLQIPSKASLNVHPSLLPKYRGAAPLTWQILNGDQEVGISIAEVTKDLDAGDIFEQIKIPRPQNATTESLQKELSALGAKALLTCLDKLRQNRLSRKPQDHSQSSYARKLTKEDGHLNLSEDAQHLEWKVKALYPWPGAFIGYKDQPLKIIEATSSSDAKNAEIGEWIGADSSGALRIQTGCGILQLLKVQLPGRKVISAKEFANGERLKSGFVFSSFK